MASDTTSSALPLIKVSITLFLRPYCPRDKLLSGGHRRMNEYVIEQQVISPHSKTVLEKGGGWVSVSVDLFLGTPSFCLPTWWEPNEELVTLAAAPAQAVCSGKCFISLATLPAPNVGLRSSQMGDGMELGETLQPHLCPWQPRGSSYCNKMPTSSISILEIQALVRKGGPASSLTHST